MMTHQGVAGYKQTIISEITFHIKTRNDDLNKAHPWVRGSSHCVVLVLWLTKYTRSLESTRLSKIDKNTVRNVYLNRQNRHWMNTCPIVRADQCYGLMLMLAAIYDPCEQQAVFVASVIQ